MKKIFIVLLMAVAALNVFGQPSQAKLFANFLQSNRKQIAAIYKSNRVIALPNGDSIKAGPRVSRGNYLFLSTNNKGLEIMFGFRSNRYIGKVTGLLYVYVTGMDSIQATRAFYSNKNLTGIFLTDKKSEAIIDAGQLIIPIFNFAVYELPRARQDKLITIVEEIVAALKK